MTNAVVELAHANQFPPPPAGGGNCWSGAESNSGEGSLWFAPKPLPQFSRAVAPSKCPLPQGGGHHSPGGSNGNPASSAGQALGIRGMGGGGARIRKTTSEGLWLWISSLRCQPE